MALPSLSDFDPNTGRFTNVAPVIRIPQNTRTSSSSSYSGTSTVRSRSLWTRFNDAVAEVGNWFAEHVDKAISVCCFLVIAAVVILAIIYVITTFIQEGLIWAIVVGVICCVVGYFTVGLSWYVILFLVNVVMYGLRLIFWNGWTLLLVLCLIGGSMLTQCVSGLSSGSSAPTEEVVQSTSSSTQVYRCTAQVLNIRTQPNTSSGVLGVLRDGDTVEVQEIVNGFACILYNGQEGYVSMKYMRLVE